MSDNLRERLRELARQEPLTPTSICVVVADWLGDEATAEQAARVAYYGMWRDSDENNWELQQEAIRDIQKHLRAVVSAALKGGDA